MGAFEYAYLVRWTDDPQAALDALRAREFAAGRYHPVMQVPRGGESPGPQHATIAEACEAAGENGTRSILDIERISDRMAPFVAAAVEPDLLEEWFGTVTPDQDDLTEDAMAELSAVLERGCCVFFVVWDEGEPVKLAFVGLSCD